MVHLTRRRCLIAAMKDRYFAGLFESLGRRVRILPTADSELGRLHAGEHGKIVRQIGTLEEGIRGYTVRVSNGEEIDLKLSEVEFLD